MDPNPPPNPTQGTQPHQGPDHQPKPGQNRAPNDEKSMRNVFPANSAGISDERRTGRNVSGQNDPTKTNDRPDGNKTNPKQQGPPSAPERGTASTPSTSSTTSTPSTAGPPREQDPRPLVRTPRPSPPRPRRARKPTRSTRTSTPTPTASTRQLLKRRIQLIRPDSEKWIRL